MPVRKPIIDRKGIIDLEQAKQRFHEYYNNRSKTKIARIRAKMFDAKYQKKPKYVLTPGEPGSAKYLLEEGPRSFDMKGVDYFPEGERIDIDDPEYNKISIVSSGSTNKRDDTDDPEELEKIYGPRIKTSKRLYSKHFGDKFRGRREEGDLKEKKLIEIYWEKYRNNPERYRRKNKREKVVSIELVQFWVGEDPYFISKEGNIFNSDGENIDNINLEGLLSEIKEEVIESLNELDLLEELDDDKYDIDQSAFRQILAEQKIERGDISFDNSSNEPSIISDESSQSTTLPSLFSSSTKKSSKETTKKSSKKSSDSSTPYRLPSPFSSSKETTKKSSKKSSEEPSSEEPSSEEESLEISLEESSDSSTPYKLPSPFSSSTKKSSKEPSSEEESLEISLNEPSEDEQSENEPSENEQSENESGEEETEIEGGDFEITPGLNEDKSTGKRYYIEQSDSGDELYIFNENKSIRVGKIKIDDESYLSFKKLGINPMKLISIEEESESKQSGGTYYDEVSIDEYELKELEKLAGLR